MDRRTFLNGSLSGPLASAAQTAAAAIPGPQIMIERAAQGTPHTGKVLALITPHLDDGPIFAGGTVAKLLAEGYTGYFIRTSNDEKDSYRKSLGETVLANERDTAQFVKVMGLKQSFDLSYRNHRMDDVGRTEIRSRLIFLFRLLKIDTVLSYDPWGHYEENPDHYVTAQAVEAACWMAGGNLDYPEHFAAGLKPHSVSEKYYFARGPQLVNRVVDTSAVHIKKLAAIRSCDTMLRHMVADVNDGLADKKLQIKALAGNDDHALTEYMKVVLSARDQTLGIANGLEFAEQFHYIGPDQAWNDYVAKNAVPL